MIGVIVPLPTKAPSNEEQKRANYIVVLKIVQDLHEKLIVQDRITALAETTKMEVLYTLKTVMSRLYDAIRCRSRYQIPSHYAVNYGQRMKSK